MTTTRREQTEVRRLAEASAWRVRLAEAGVESSTGFEAWLDSDEANAEAWRRVQAPWTAFGETATSTALMVARRDALNNARRQSHRRWAGRSWVGRAAAACAAVAVLAAGGYGAVSWERSRPDVYDTTLGERRVVLLADGSRLSLDSASEVRIRYTRDARRLQILRGQARFDVAHDELRPFSVQARDQTVVATGTAFNVDLLGPRILVTLIEGRVVVLDRADAPRAAADPAPARPRRIALTAGQQLVVTPAAPPRVETVRLDRASAWETGQLLFEDEPLSSVAERVSRYAGKPVTVDDSAAALRISGVFRAGDVDTFVDAVTSYLPVAASRRQDGGVVLRREG
jgi:transmembrane sensor